MEIEWLLTVGFLALSLISRLLVLVPRLAYVPDKPPKTIGQYCSKSLKSYFCILLLALGISAIPSDIPTSQLVLKLSYTKQIDLMAFLHTGGAEVVINRLQLS